MHLLSTTSLPFADLPTPMKRSSAPMIAWCSREFPIIGLMAWYAYLWTRPITYWWAQHVVTMVQSKLLLPWMRQSTRYPLWTIICLNKRNYSAGTNASDTPAFIGYNCSCAQQCLPQALHIRSFILPHARSCTPAAALLANLESR
jgi:hypothetical protein